LYIKKGTRFSPFIIGGHQESDRRGGTENVPGIVGLGEAARLAMKNFDEENSRVRKLRDRLQEGLSVTIAAARVNGHLESRLPNTLNIGFEFVEGEAILMRMDEKGICASSGSACTSGSLEPSWAEGDGVPSPRFTDRRFSLSSTTRRRNRIRYSRAFIIIEFLSSRSLLAENTEHRCLRRRFMKGKGDEFCSGSV
jgi:cysteine desulfurase